MRKLSTNILGIIAIICLLISTSTAQEEQGDADGLRLIAATPLSAITDSNFAQRQMQLSPDGTLIAWFDFDELCVYTIAANTSNCITVPEPTNLFKFHWSPDSRLLVFEESVFQIFVDSDIWLFDVTAQQFINRTDDNSEARLMFGDGSENPPLVDYLPTWDASNGDLYFLRWQPESDDRSGLYRIAGGVRGIMGLGGGSGELLDNTEPELALDLTAQLPRLSIFNTEAQILEGIAAISPDGSTIAVIVRSSDFNDPLSGLWLINLSTSDIIQVMTSERLLATINRLLPAWEESPMQLDSLTWQDDDTLLIAAANLQDLTTQIGWNIIQYDLDEDRESGSVNPLLIFNTIESETDYINREESNGLIAPRHATQLPGTDLLLYYNVNRFGRNPGNIVWGLNLDENTPTPQAITALPDDDEIPVVLYQASAGRDSNTIRVLIGTYLLTFEVTE